MNDRPPEPHDGERAEAQPPGAFFHHAAIFYLLLAVAGVVWLGLDRGVVPLTVFLDPGRLHVDLALGAGAGALLLLGWQACRRWSTSAVALEGHIRQLLGHLSAADALVLAVLSGFAEELFFRGAMQASWGWPWATAVFALLHTGPGRAFRIWTLFAVVAGLAFAALTELRGNLLPAVIAHAGINAVNLRRLIAPAPADGESC